MRQARAVPVAEPAAGGGGKFLLDEVYGDVDIVSELRGLAASQRRLEGAFDSKVTQLAEQLLREIGNVEGHLRQDLKQLSHVLTGQDGVGSGLTYQGSGLTYQGTSASDNSFQPHIRISQADTPHGQKREPHLPHATSKLGVDGADNMDITIPWNNSSRRPSAADRRLDPSPSRMSREDRLSVGPLSQAPSQIGLQPSGSGELRFANDVSECKASASRKRNSRFCFSDTTSEFGAKVTHMQSDRGNTTNPCADLFQLGHRPVALQDSAEPRSPRSDQSDPQHIVVPTLPASWPAVLKMREGLHQMVSYDMNHRSMDQTAAVIRALSEDDRVVDESFLGRWLRFFTVHPQSKVRQCIDFCNLMVLTYELTATPYVLAWQVPLDDVVRSLASVTATYWTLLIGMGFMSGFFEGGELKMDLCDIAKHYFRSWFWLDAITATSDWLSLAMSGSAARYLRLVGLLRTARMVALIEHCIDRTFSENLRLTLRFMSLFALILFFNHWMCCTFYTIGRLGPNDTGGRWINGLITVNGELDDEIWSKPYHELSDLYQYLTVFHWYMSQMTVGNEMIYCYTSMERVFNIFGLLAGLFINSTLVSSLSASMVDFNIAKKDQKLKMRMLIQYLAENKVGNRVAVLVQKQVMERMHNRGRLLDTDVQALSLISSSMRAELRSEIFVPHLTRHPLFQLWALLDKGTIQQLCFEAVNFTHLMPQDDLFSAGSKCTEAYFVTKGTLNFTEEPESSPLGCFQRTPIYEHTWLCEAALWTEWIHVGNAQAVTESHLLVVSSEGVLAIFRRHRAIAKVTAEYGAAFHLRVVSACPPDSKWPTDLEVPFTDFPELVMSMDPEVQCTVGLSAITQVEAQKGWVTKSTAAGKGPNIEKLSEEVRKGKSTVICNSQGELERVASVVALRIVGDNGELFVQVGKWENDQMLPACQLPGGKQERGELPVGAMRRMLQAKLTPLAEHVQIQYTERQVVLKESKELRVQTKYLRTVCHTRLTDEFFADSCRTKDSMSFRLGATRSDLVDTSASNASAASNGPASPASHGRHLAPPPEGAPQRPSTGSTGKPRFSFMGAESTTKNNPDERPPSDRDVYIFRSDGKIAFYTWLTPRQFDYLQSSAGETTLRRWLGNLDFDPALDLYNESDAAAEHTANTTTHAVAGI